MKVKFCQRDTVFPGEFLGELRESNDCIGNRNALKSRFEQDGYLFFRELIDHNTVLQARQVIVNYLASQDSLVPDQPALEAVMPQDAASVKMLGYKGIAQHPQVLEVLENRVLFDFFQSFFDEPCTTFKYKWLRAVGNEHFTGCHYDVLYMGRGSQRLHTAWIPFGDIPVNQGTLAVCAGSHNLDLFAGLRNTYGRLDVDRDLVDSGWFSEDPQEIVTKFGGRWLTTSYRAGDVLIFGMYTLHASTTNLTNRYRISCDVRFQPASEPPDERWIGKTPVGHYAWGSKVKKTIAEVRKEWDL